MNKLFLRMVALLAPLSFASTALAQDAASNEFDERVARALAAGLAIGIAAVGGALGQGKGLAAMLDGISRNPNAAGKMFVPMILGLALIESLVIYALVVALGLKPQ